MPIWLLTLIPPVINLIAKLVDKYVPDKVTHKREFKTKKKCVEVMNKFHGWTIEEIAAYGNKREAQRKRRDLDDSGNTQ